MCQVIKENAAHDQCCSLSSLIIIVHSAVTLLIRHLYCCNIAKSALQHSATDMPRLHLSLTWVVHSKDLGCTLNYITVCAHS